MSLADLQRAFQAHLMSGDDGIVELVEPAMRRGLPVYAYAYRATLCGALRDTFEKTLLWLGEDEFHAAADAYLDAIPSQSWTLSDYGDRFAAHLTDTSPHDPEVGEIAWLDWALRSAFAAGSLPPLDPAALAAVDWEVATLTLAPHLDFRAVHTNVIDVWNGLPDAAVATVRLKASIGLIVWRNDLSPEFRSADPFEVIALAMLCEGQSFATMCAALAEDGGDAGLIGGWLSGWLRDGLVSVGG
jgi:hypothetical protein